MSGLILNIRLFFCDHGILAVFDYLVHGANHRVVGQFGVAETGALTEPSAVAPDAAVNLGDDGREYKGSGKTHFLHGSRIKFIQFTLGCILLNKEVDSSIRRYRARFCKAIDLANSKLTHYQSP